jgi:hypothetical protein
MVWRTIPAGRTAVKPPHIASTENALLGFTLMHSITAKASTKSHEIRALRARGCVSRVNVPGVPEENTHGFEES